jgi:hypothetical protein
MDLDMTDVKASVFSLVIVTIMAIVGITLAKVAAEHLPLPEGLKSLILAV